MAKHIEDLSQFLQTFGVAPLALLLLPVLITALASFLVALRMMALNKEIADLTSRVHQLEGAEHRRLMLEIKESGASLRRATGPPKENGGPSV